MQSLYAIGQIMHHKLFGYRGVIYDVDPEFAGTDQWYENMARSQPPRDRPWYHVLVDGAEHTTYVAERNLEPDAVLEPIRHPSVLRGDVSIVRADLYRWQAAQKTVVRPASMRSRRLSAHR